MCSDDRLNGFCTASTPKLDLGGAIGRSHHEAGSLRMRMPIYLSDDEVAILEEIRDMGTSKRRLALRLLKAAALEDVQEEGV